MVQYFGNPRNPRRRSYAPAWSPADIAELLLDFDAEQYAYSDAGTTLCTDGQSVYRWYDTTHTVYVEQTSAGSRPIFGQGANGKKFIDFNGGKRMEGSASISSTLRQMWVTSLKRNSFTDNTFFYFHSGSGSSVTNASDQASGGNHARFDYVGATGSALSLGNTGASTTAWETFGLRIDATDASALRDGAVEGSAALTGVNAADFTTLRIGGWLSAGYEANFKLQRHMLFVTEPSSGDQSDLQTYLAANVPT